MQVTVYVYIWIFHEYIFDFCTISILCYFINLCHYIIEGNTVLHLLYSCNFSKNTAKYC